VGNQADKVEYTLGATKNSAGELRFRSVQVQADAQEGAAIGTTGYGLVTAALGALVNAVTQFGSAAIRSVRVLQQLRIPRSWTANPAVARD